jgi:hypothetical protein
VTHLVPKINQLQSQAIPFAVSSYAHLFPNNQIYTFVIKKRTNQEIYKIFDIIYDCP